MSWYSQRVERDLARWQAAGWVGDAGAASIKSDLASRTSTFGVAGIFAILGAVLFGFAIMSFVAAHWTTMSKLARLALILATLWGCYAAAAYLFARKLDAFAQAAILAGIAAYGAGIMLIAQMYHMEGNPPDAVLYLGARGAAGSRPPAIAPGAGRHVRSACRVVGVGTHAQRWRALGLPARVGGCRRGGGMDGLAPGPASCRDQPRLSGWSPSASSCWAGMHTG